MKAKKVFDIIIVSICSSFLLWSALDIISILSKINFNDTLEGVWIGYPVIIVTLGIFAPVSGKVINSIISLFGRGE